MFDANIPMKSKLKNSIEMDCGVGSSAVQRFRPKPTIVGKSEAKGWTNFLAPIDNDRLVSCFGGQYVNSPRGVQIRDARSFEARGELAGPDAPFAVNPGKSHLLAEVLAPWGTHVGVQLIDLNELAVVDVFPVRAPYVWLDPSSSSFVALTPEGYFGGIAGFDPELVARHEYLRDLVTQKEILIRIDPNAREGRCINSEPFGDDGWKDPKHLALSLDQTKIYYATDTTAGALDLNSGKVVWKHRLGYSREPSMYFIYAFAMSQDGRYLAAGGLSTEDNDKNNFVILDTQDGELVFAASLSKELARGAGHGNTSISVIAWHESGWVAVGTGMGTIAHVTVDGDVRAYSGSPKGIKSMMFLDNQNLLVGSSEKQMRLVPLLQDEV